MSVPSRSGQQPSRIFYRPDARGLFGRSRGMGRFHAAIRDCTGALCACGGRSGWPDRCRPFAWPQARCGRGCRSGGLGHGAHTVYWLGASINRLRCGADRSFLRLFGDSDRGDLVGRPRRILAPPSPNTGSDSGNGLSRFAARRVRNAYDFFSLTDRVAPASRKRLTT